jgi:serine/threonine protein kinase
MSEHFPRQFGKYVLLRSLARGGMGELYLAGSGQGSGLAKLCVIKRVIAHRSDAAKVNRFFDEAKVVLRLSHANLVTTFDAGEVDGESFIAMEQVEGKDLREVWNRCVRTRTRIPLDVALIVAREVARALSYVHSYGELRLVHRDVAPPNILLSYFGEVKLTDFGLARSTLKREHTTPGVVFGRASYLSPEQARGEVADARTDLYSLGIVTWELLTGQPYLQLAGLDPVSSLALVRNPQPEPPSTRAPWITAELDAVVLRALAPERRNRFASAEEFRRGLSEVMSRVAPRADSDRVAEFLRGLYREVIAEERAERDRLLAEILPRFLGDSLGGDDATPTTSLVALDAVAHDDDDDLRGLRGVALTPDGGPGRFGSGFEAEVGAEEQPGALILDPAGEPGSGRRWSGPQHPAELTLPQPADGQPGSADAPGSGEAAAAPEVLPAFGPEDLDHHHETLHASALRVRSDFRVRRLPVDPLGSDEPTTVWSERGDGTGARDGASGTGGGAADGADRRIIDGRYRIHRRIGEGGMGTVYAAEHVEIGKSVAVKILHLQYSGDEQLVERFRREARAASRVGHPNIIDVTDFGTTDDGCAFFVMELLHGMDLADVLAREQRLGTERAVRIAVQVCRALQAAHEVGIIHRDLKPENIYLVARDGETDFVKVLDFGIAQNLAFASGRLTNPGMAMGTPEYMAPEQALAGPVDGRTDVYALGALTYEMLMGIAPHKDGPADTILERKMKPPVSLRAQRPDVSPGLDAVIRQALEADPDRRPQTMAQLEYELTKTVWGRGKAVAEMLGLHAETRHPTETPVPVTAPPEVADVSAAGPEAGPRVETAPTVVLSGGARPGVAPGAAQAEDRDPAAGDGDRDVDGLEGAGGAVGVGVGAGGAGGAGDADADADAADEDGADVRTPGPSVAAPPPDAVPPTMPTPPARPVSPVATFPAVGPTIAASGRGSRESPPLAIAHRGGPAARPRTRSPALAVAVGVAASIVVVFGILAARHGPARSVEMVSQGFVGLARLRPQVAARAVGAAAGARPRVAGRILEIRRGRADDLVRPAPAVPRLGPAFTGMVGANREGVAIAAPPPLLSPTVSPTLPATAAPAVERTTAGSAAPPVSGAPIGPVGAVRAPAPRPPEVVLTSPVQHAREALAAGAPGDAVAALRGLAERTGLAPDERSLLVDALVASGWQDARVYRWQSANRKAREALAQLTGGGQPSRGAHALLGEGLYALGDFRAALDQFTLALGETPRDARLKRQVIRSRRHLQEKSTPVATEPAAEE